MTISEAQQQLTANLAGLYNKREAAGIADLVMEQLTGKKRIDRIVKKDIALTDFQQHKLIVYTGQLLKHSPVQYVLNEAWFAGLKFYVDENVLIPRPETEELVEWITATLTGKKCSIIDIGTGSGCIPVALKMKLPDTEVHAVDISNPALEVAKKNALMHHAEIHFQQMDILNKEVWNLLPQFDIIVSNPPYIKESEAKEMKDNVLMHEPHLALFVPDNDPLLFYKEIADFALIYLKENGLLFFEINETFGEETAKMLGEKGFQQVEIKKDLQYKDRMIKAELNS